MSNKFSCPNMRGSSFIESSARICLLRRQLIARIYERNEIDRQIASITARLRELETGHEAELCELEPSRDTNLPPSRVSGGTLP